MADTRACHHPAITARPKRSCRRTSVTPANRGRRGGRRRSGAATSICMRGTPSTAPTQDPKWFREFAPRSRSAATRAELTTGGAPRVDRGEAAAGAAQPGRSLNMG